MGIPLGESAWAEDFSTTNVQVLYGGAFRDPFFGYDTADGRLTTVTLEHFGTWAYGDNYFFVDFLSRSFVDFSGKSTGKTSRIYGEWHPRLSLSRLSGHDLSFSIVKDVLIAGQINRDGEGFKANLLGMGTNLEIPGFNFVELDAYARKDNFNSLTYQVTVAWDLPFGSLPVSLSGYVDINGTDTHGTEVNAQPQLLLDAGSVLGLPGHHLQVAWNDLLVKSPLWSLRGAKRRGNLVLCQRVRDCHATLAMTNSDIFGLFTSTSWNGIFIITIS